MSHPEAVLCGFGWSAPTGAWRVPMQFQSPWGVCWQISWFKKEVTVLSTKKVTNATHLEQHSRNAAEFLGNHNHRLLCFLTAETKKPEHRVPKQKSISLPSKASSLFKKQSLRNVTRLHSMEKLCTFDGKIGIDAYVCYLIFKNPWNYTFIGMKHRCLIKIFYTENQFPSHKTGNIKLLLALH